MILAAGASERLGSPKALLPFGDRTVLSRQVERAVEAGVDAGVIVTGDADEAIRAAVDPAPFRWIRNPEPDSGRTGSLRCGLAHVPEEADILMWPVDRPLASLATVQSLLERAGSGEIARPETGGRCGHPVLLPATVRSAIEEADPDANLRGVLAATGAGVTRVRVGDPGIHFNLDTREAYEMALAWWSDRNPQFG
ncbi:MAG: nucleotidyltransferase family protein [Gemmatimonadetes bacterium]|nr:nucleotidyltransferase family protein [Gemmatimonadota bacterium]